MANSRQGNVEYVDTTATTISDAREIKGIKYIGNTSGTAAITGADSGDPLWEEAGTANVFDEVCIRSDKGFTVTLTNGAVVYIYWKV